MKIFSGSANKPLGEKIAKALGLDISSLEIHIFPDGERRICVLDSVVNEDAVVVQPTAPPVDQNYMELFFIVDALKRSGAKSVTSFVPYLGYQRQDHVFRSGEAVSLEVVLKTLEAVGTNKIIVIDLHSIKTEQVSKTPLIHLSALPLFAKKIKEIIRPRRSHALDLRGRGGEDVILVSPDMGGIRRVKIISEMLDGMPFVAIEKERDLTTGRVTAQKIHGETKKHVFIIDDMISSGKTIETAANLLRDKGVEEIFVFATHPVLSDDAPNVLQEANVDKVFVTDSIDVPKEKRFDKLEIISIASTIANELKA